MKRKQNYFFNYIFLKEFGGKPVGTRCYAVAEDGHWLAKFYDGSTMVVDSGFLSYSLVHHSHLLYEINEEGEQQYEGFCLLLEDGEEAIVQKLSTFEQIRVSRDLLVAIPGKPIISVRDFEVGHYYQAINIPFGNTEVIKCHEEPADEKGVKLKWLDQRIWAMPDNPSAMTRWIEFRKVELPNHFATIGRNVRQLNNIGA